MHDCEWQGKTGRVPRALGRDDGRRLNFELIEPMGGEQSRWQEFVDKKGEGITSIAVMFPTREESERVKAQFARRRNRHHRRRPHRRRHRVVLPRYGDHVQVRHRVGQRPRPRLPQGVVHLSLRPDGIASRDASDANTGVGGTHGRTRQAGDRSTPKGVGLPVSRRGRGRARDRRHGTGGVGPGRLRGARLRRHARLRAQSGRAIAEPHRRLRRQRLDLRDHADLRPARRGRRRRVATTGSRRVMDVERGRPDMDVHAARCPVQQRRPGDRRGREVLPGPLEGPRDQHLATAAWRRASRAWTSSTTRPCRSR